MEDMLVALETYNKKRDFTDTPEPRGKVSKQKIAEVCDTGASRHSSAFRSEIGNGRHAEKLGGPERSIIQSR
jgi:hypothetical protein